LDRLGEDLRLAREQVVGEQRGLEAVEADAVDRLAEALLLVGVFLEPEHRLFEQRLDLLAADEAAQRRTHAGLLAPRAADVDAVARFALVPDGLERAFADADAALQAVFPDGELAVHDVRGLRGTARLDDTHLAVAAVVGVEDGRAAALNAEIVQ